MPAKKSAPKPATKSVVTPKAAAAKPAAKKSPPKSAPAKPVAKPAPAKVAPKKVAPKPAAVVKKTPAPVAAKVAPKSVVAAKPAAKPSAAAAKPAAKVAAKVPAIVSKAPAGLVEVAFERYSPNSGAVDLVGSFNDWKLGKNPLKRDANGLWSTKLKLKPGHYEYKYVYDGLSYEPDPDREQVPGPFGSANNLLVVT